MSSSKQYDVVIMGSGIIGLYCAMKLATRGKQVALVERGPADLEEKMAAYPPLEFLERVNEGSLEARNHVVGGNSAFWGGGLIRQRDKELVGMLDLQSDAAEQEIAAHCNDVETCLGIAYKAQRGLLKAAGLTLNTCEIVVLPGKKRNLGRRFLQRALRSRQVDLYSSCEVSGLTREWTGTLSAIHVRNSTGDIAELAGRSFILSMGVIDSVLFGLRFAEDLGVKQNAVLGNELHDHLSVPLFEITRTSNGRFDTDLLPYFKGSLIIGRRIELQDEGSSWNPSGFLHFQCIFEEAEPYSTIKRIMELRQKGFNLGEVLHVLRAGVWSFPEFIKIAWDKCFGNNLYISPKVRIVATLDFESCPSKENSLVAMQVGQGEERAGLSWNLRKQDEETFKRLYEKSETIIRALAKHYGFRYGPVRESESSASIEAHFKKCAHDSYHLGGGLRAGISPEDSICGPDLTWHGIPNLYVMSTAAFRRPGSANPVLTLLALADRLSITL